VWRGLQCTVPSGMEVIMVLIRKFFAAILLVVLAGCLTASRVERRSNLMSYLYPDANGPQTPNPAGARLQLPLRIGLAFVPPDHGQSRFAGEFRSTFPAATETRLLNIVK